MTPFRFVFFDVDSTLASIEGIDILGDNNPEIARLTEAAMNGEIALDEVYGRRLELIRPTRAAVESLGDRYVESLVPGAARTVASLQDARVQVHLVTAGIEQAILPLAASLNIPQRAVHAVRLRFDEQGNYEDFDRRSFLTKSGGKELVVRDVRARTHGRAALVGDGVSDLEAKAAVDLFIGFGGVAVREKVKQNAEVYAMSFDEVLSALS
ncbi:MAG: phosphoserine phosphatase [Acidimicrobiaceae bacterium]